LEFKWIDIWIDVKGGIDRMRKIKLDKWKSKTPDGKELDEDLLIALNVLIGSKDPKDMPRGLDKARIFNKLIKAFDKADKTRILELEETEYMFLKTEVEGSIPAAWGMNSNIMNAIESFLEAKSE